MSEPRIHPDFSDYTDFVGDIIQNKKLPEWAAFCFGDFMSSG
jgi:hypothetical protein